MLCIWNLSFGTEPVPILATALSPTNRIFTDKLSTGRFTIPILLFLMLPIVLTAGPSRESLLPWLPFILTVMSFITVGVDEALPYLRRTNDDDSRFMRLESGRSTTVSTRPPPSNPRSPDPSDFRFTGPPSRAVSRCSGSEASSGVNLHSVQGVVRPSWGVSTLSFWQSQDAHEVPRAIGTEPPTQTMGIDQDLEPELTGTSDDLDSRLSTSSLLHNLVQRSV